MRDSGNASLVLILFLSGSLPGLIPRSHDSVPQIRSGLIYSKDAANSDLFRMMLQQFTVRRRILADLVGMWSVHDDAELSVFEPILDVVLMAACEFVLRCLAFLEVKT